MMQLADITSPTVHLVKDGLYSTIRPLKLFKPAKSSSPKQLCCFTLAMNRAADLKTNDTLTFHYISIDDKIKCHDMHASGS